MNKEFIMYQIYPLGFCNAPKENDETTVSRIKKVIEWTDYYLELGVDTILFNPIFESDKHGYDTRDYGKIDCRLGTNQDFKEVCSNLKSKNIRIILDGVFNHVGRGFWAFQDVLTNRQNSKYNNWFYIDFDKNNGHNDGLYYEGWEGHYDLVKLNLQNEDVINHIFNNIENWIKDFDIDGLRLDVAYCLDKEFLKKLRIFCESIKPNFHILGEVLFGDYSELVNNDMLHSCTNYECFKGLFSSFNDMNLFEISYSLNRLFGIDNSALYKGLNLLKFVDNHDVSRIATILKNKNHLPLVYGLMFGMPGIPCIYYGSEWGQEGDKKISDYELRPSFDEPIYNELTNWIKKLIKIHKDNKVLTFGDYNVISITNKQLVFERNFEGEKIIIALNSEESKADIKMNGYEFNAVDLLSESEIVINNKMCMEGYSIMYLKRK
jgi:glycosidase